MPLHDYLCKKCGHRFERIQKFSDPPVKKCPECGGALEQVLHAPAVQFKGTGWYVTDYARKGGDKSSKESSSTESKPSSEKTDVKASSEPKKSEKKKK